VQSVITVMNTEMHRGLTTQSYSSDFIMMII
jgi:hypothetical protein